MQQGHSCLAQYSIREKNFSNLQFIHTSIAALTAKPEVVDNVINPLFQRFTSSDASSLLQKNKTKIKVTLAQRNKIRWPAYSEKGQVDQTLVLFGKLAHMCNM